MAFTTMPKWPVMFECEYFVLGGCPPPRVSVVAVVEMRGAWQGGDVCICTLPRVSPSNPLKRTANGTDEMVTAHSLTRLK